MPRAVREPLQLSLPLFHSIIIAHSPFFPSRKRDTSHPPIVFQPKNTSQLKQTGGNEHRGSQNILDTFILFVSFFFFFIVRSFNLLLAHFPSRFTKVMILMKNEL